MLKDHFKETEICYDKKNDQHIFCLIDPSLGKYNSLQLKFTIKKLNLRFNFLYI